MPPTSPSPRRRSRRSGDWLRGARRPDLDLGDLIRDIPLPILRIIDLARALAVEPDLLLLDEMTAALPADLTERVMDVVGRQRASRGGA